MTVTVKAESAFQAQKIVERNYMNSEYVLDADHYKGVVITVPARNDRER